MNLILLFLPSEKPDISLTYRIKPSTSSLLQLIRQASRSLGPSLEKVMTLLDLPEEILDNISKRLSPLSVKDFRLTCKLCERIGSPYLLPDQYLGFNCVNRLETIRQGLHKTSWILNLHLNVNSDIQSQ